MHRNQADKQRTEYDYLVKVQVLGDEDAGKSSLILRFADNKYDSIPISTIGVDFKIRTMEVDNNVCKMQIWDSKPIPTYINTGYIGGAHVIVIAVDMSKNFLAKNLQQWLEFVERHAKENVFVAIVGTKIDKTDNLQIQKNIQDLKEYFNGLDNDRYVMGFVSSKTGESVEELFGMIAETMGEKLEINKPSLEEKQKFIKQLKNITQDKIFWSDKIREKETEIPASVKNINQLLNQAGKEPDEILKEVKESAYNVYSSMFQWAHNLFRGRNEATNEFYKILCEMDTSKKTPFENTKEKLDSYMKKYEKKDLSSSSSAPTVAKEDEKSSRTGLGGIYKK